jgi:hypothetical protein
MCLALACTTTITPCLLLARAALRALQHCRLLRLMVLSMLAIRTWRP